MPENAQRWIAVLGRRDEPTDALEDYCRLLAAALQPQGCSLEIHRITWAERGWRRALSDLDKYVLDRRPRWALVQYTALSWSRRGFPIRFARLIRRLKRGGVRVAVVYHDPLPFAGSRLRDRVRRKAQLAAMRESARLADRIVTTISPDCVPWMRADAIRAKISLVPAGSNMSEPSLQKRIRGEGPPVVAVFGVTERRREEAMLIARVVLRVAENFGRARLIVLGRGGKLAEATLREALESSPVDLEVSGIISREHAAALLAEADVQLFVRSGLTSSRGSAIAGIACGLPIVGFSNEETAFPVTEAGVRLVPMGNVDQLIEEMLAVLGDEKLRESLSQRSRDAAERYFSWQRISEQYRAALG